MMRSLILSVALLAALGACGKKTPADATPEPDAVADAGAPPAMDAEDPAGEPVEPASVLPDPQTTDIADLPRTITVDNDTLKADISFDEAIFGYAPAMAMGVVEDARIRLSAIKEDAAAYKKAEPQYFHPYGLKIDWKLTGAAGGLAGLEGFQYSYTGGAHGNYMTDGRIYSTLTGDQLRLSDLFTDPAADMAAQMDFIHDAIAKQKTIAANNPGAYATFLGEAKDAVTERDVLGGEISLVASTEPGKLGGYVIHFAPYEIGSYAEGAYHIVVPQSAFHEFLKPDFTGAFAGEPVDVQRPDKQN